MMDIAQATVDFDKYTNGLGFVTNTPGGSSGNDLLYSAEACWILSRLIWQLSEFRVLPAIFRRTAESIREHSRLKSGLFCRPGWEQDQEQPDDYYGICLINSVYAEEILQYGRKHFWYFRTSSNCAWYEPMFFRFPAFIAHVHWCAGENPNWFLRLWWATSVAYSGSGDNEDPWILSWILTQGIGSRGGWLERWATRKYQRRRTKIRGTLKEIFAHYFKDSEHPISKYCLE